MLTATETLLSPATSAGSILALVEGDGTAASSHAAALLRNDARGADLADAVHALCIVHGAFPGIVDSALSSCTDDAVRTWLGQAAEVMTAERAVLQRLAVAVGPQPSTAGQAASDMALRTQRLSLETLARSERCGSALGTVLAFLLDWLSVRDLLSACAQRLGMTVGGGFARVVAAGEKLVDVDALSPAERRAVMFGAQQMLAQHRGLWQLLEARASARKAA